MALGRLPLLNRSALDSIVEDDGPSSQISCRDLMRTHKQAPGSPIASVKLFALRLPRSEVSFEE
jgi:hypothetical protein